jgi:hypothetical protein
MIAMNTVPKMELASQQYGFMGGEVFSVSVLVTCKQVLAEFLACMTPRSLENGFQSYDSVNLCHNDKQKTLH